MHPRAGKSLRLLKNSEQGGANTSNLAFPGLTPLAPLVPPLRAKGLNAGARHRAPLQQQFLDQLHAFLAGHELCPAVQMSEGQGQQGVATATEAAIGGQQGAAIGGSKGLQWGQGQQGATMGGGPAGQAGPDGAGGVTTGAHREEVQHVCQGSVLHPLPLYPPTQPAQPASSALLLPSSVFQSARGEGEAGGAQGSGSCTAALPLNFSGRMAAAGLSRSTLQAGWTGPPVNEALQPPLSCAGENSVADKSTHGWRGDKHRLGSGGEAGGLSMGTMGGRDLGKGRGAQGQQGGGSGLEAQCNSIAAAMSKDNPSLAWEAEDRHHQSNGSI
eukprot:1150646-Pelagomonas_calceolata.AAC.1